MLPPEGGRAAPLNGVRVGLEGWLRGSAHPPGGAVCRDRAQCPAFAPSTSEAAVGFWPFCVLLFMRLFVVPHVCAGASTAAKGPWSLVPACLTVRVCSLALYLEMSPSQLFTSVLFTWSG